MGFNKSKASKLLAECHRRCCICHRFCGVKMELHHIEHAGDGGSDEIENAIPVCFECHAEIALYDDKHPRGRKFRPEELLEHKSQWLRVCNESPGELLVPQRSFEVGPIQALIDELGFNAIIANRTDETIGALFLVSQFERAIEAGAISLLPDTIRHPISAVYATLFLANTHLQKMAIMPWSGGESSAWGNARFHALKTIERAKEEIPIAITALIEKVSGASNN